MIQLPKEDARRNHEDATNWQSIGTVIARLVADLAKKLEQRDNA